MDERVAAKTGPQSWAFALFLAFGGAQLIAGLVFFFAYNWRDLSDPVKIALPQAAMALGFLGWAILGRELRLGAVFAVLATVMIGVSMGVVGQVYQLGADPWRLFAVWAAFALPLAIIARSDALFAVWFAIATVAYSLYADEHFPYGARGYYASAILAVYVAAAAIVLFARELVAGGAPRWLRWLIVFAALAPAVAGGIGDLTDGRHIFGRGFWASLAVLGASAAFYGFYRFHRVDRPTQAMAMFAPAIWVGALGVRMIFANTDLDSAAAASALFLISALWIV
ncbi:MAG: DUF2157 domain-containing protein, partial [Parvularculaceae bacterium]